MTPPEKSGSDRAFGLVFAAFFAILGAWPAVHGLPVRLPLLGVGGGFLLVALVAPRLLGPLNRLWLAFGELLHRVTSPIVMGVLFFAVMTPLGLFMRLVGKDGLHLRGDRDAASYWVPRTPPGPTPESCRNQF
ncbi:MAG: hypothetical protein HQL66_10465 [Magnetococcales bacterium]|nr:hypothetical protein [Magnetococcales bacterium]